jgi:hypothetical protein
LLSEVNCSIAVFESVSSSLKSLEECSNKTAANASEQIYKRIFQELAKSPHMFGCPLPCKRITYELRILYFHQNSIGSFVQKSKFWLFIYPSSTIIEDQVKLCYCALYLILRLARKFCLDSSSICQNQISTSIVYSYLLIGLE